MFKKLLFTLICLFPLAIHALTVKDKLLGAQAGDFVVTEQNKVYSILLVREISSSSIQLEEISIPQTQINLKEIPWKTWLENKSPGHSSWVAYSIDFVEEGLTEGYSFSERQWLHLDDSEYLFAKLLTLPLKKVPTAQQKKIGPPPKEGSDLRPVWIPAITKEGKRLKNPKMEVYQGKWPKDDSYLSECSILLYFDAETPSFPFPYWLEVTNGHYTFKLKTLDSGTHLQTPYSKVSLQPYYRFARPIEAFKQAFVLTVNTSAKDHEVTLYAEDKTDPSHGRIPLPIKIKNGGKTGLFKVEIPKKPLKPLLTPDHKYRLVVTPNKHPDIVLIAEDAFVWKP